MKKKQQIIALFCVLVAVLFFHTLFGCSTVETFKTGSSSSTGGVSYTPSPATFGQFMSDINSGKLTKGSQWMYTPQVGTSPYTPVTAVDNAVCEQAYSNQPMYNSSSTWNQIKQDANNKSKPASS